MFTLAKSSPEINFNAEEYKNLGERLASYGGRILLIYSQTSLDKSSVELVKDELKKHQITYIQSAVSSTFINREELEQLQVRAENFFVSIVLSIGDFNQRMCGRFISQRLSLKYFEIPTVLHNTSLLCPLSIFSNRVGTDYETMHIADNRIISIELDPILLRPYNELEKKMEMISILFDLSLLFTAKENNIISINESLNLFYRILADLKEDRLATEDIMIYSLTAMLYLGASTSCEMSLTYDTMLIAKRFGQDHRTIQAILIPHILSRVNEELSLKIRDFFDTLLIPQRLADLNISKPQLQEICTKRDEVQVIIEKSF